MTSYDQLKTGTTRDWEGEKLQGMNDLKIVFSSFLFH
jgi:hypothetical protein